MLYVVGISGSNDTTGKDCVRYGFRQNLLRPDRRRGDRPGAGQGVRQEQEGRVHDAGLHLRPHRHQVDAGLPDQGRRLDDGDQPGLAARRAGLLAPTCSTSPTPAPTCCINVNWGHDAVLSIQQAKQFGMLDKMKLVVPYQVPFLAREVGGGLMAGVYAATDFWWTLEDKYPLAKMFVEAFEKKYGYKPEWGAKNAYMQLRACGRAWSRRRAPSIRRPSSRPTRRARRSRRSVGDVHYRAEDHQLRPPGHHRQGQEAEGHEEQGGLLGRRRDRPGRRLMQKPDAFGCKLGDYT